MKTLPFPLVFLLALPVAAQPTLEHESAPEMRLALAELLAEGRCDASGDGVCDLTFVRPNPEDGTTDHFVVVNVQTSTEIGTIPYEEIVQALGGAEQFPPGETPRLLGFADVDGDGTKEAVFRGPGAVAIIGILVAKRQQMPFSVPARRLALFDIDNDGKVELVVGNPETRTVQIYGSGGTGTATEDDVRQALARLTQNYPNPFRETTTITYAVDRPGPVALEVFDLLGRHVITLVEARHTAGTHHITWDGADKAGRLVAAGPYFYRLRIGQTLSSKTALRLR